MMNICIGLSEKNNYPKVRPGCLWATARDSYGSNVISVDTSLVQRQNIDSRNTAGDARDAQQNEPGNTDTMLAINPAQHTLCGTECDLDARTQRQETIQGMVGVAYHIANVGRSLKTSLKTWVNDQKELYYTVLKVACPDMNLATVCGKTNTNTLLTMVNAFNGGKGSL